MNDRRAYIGGADIAAVLGVSPWMTPVDLYLQKISDQPEPELTPEKRRFFARRKQQEPVVARMLEEEYGIEVTTLSLDTHPNRYTDPEHAILRAEIDFEFLMSPSVRAHFPDREDFAAIPDGTLLNGEIKTVHPFTASEWGEQGSEEVPIHYAAQVMHGLCVTRRPAALVAALFGIDILLCFPIMADPETIADMRERCVRFWYDNVLARVPPETVNMDDISRLYAMAKGRPVELDTAALAALKEVALLRYDEKRISEALEDAKLVFAKYVAKQWGYHPEEAAWLNDNADLRYQGISVGTWKRQRSAYLDQELLKAERPEIIKLYTVERHSRILRIAKGAV